MKKILYLCCSCLIVIGLLFSLTGCPKATDVPDQVTVRPKPTIEPKVGNVPIKPMK